MNLILNKVIVDNLLSLLAAKYRYYDGDKNIILSCFKKLTDLNAIIYTTHHLSSLSSEMFFYYVENKNLDIHSYLLTDAVRHNNDEHVCDWIFKQWELQDNIYAIDTLCELAYTAYYHNKNDYFARIIQKIYDQDKIDIIIFYIINAYYLNNDLLKYISESIFYDNFLFLQLIKISQTTDNNFSKFIMENEDAKWKHDDILKQINNHRVVSEKYQNIMNDLTSLRNIYYA